MYAKVILASPERRLYAAQVSINRGITVFELVSGAPLRVGDVVRASFGFSHCGEQEAQNQMCNERLVITVVRSGITPVSAQICLQDIDACRILER